MRPIVRPLCNGSAESQAKYRQARTGLFGGAVDFSVPAEEEEFAVFVRAEGGRFKEDGGFLLAFGRSLLWAGVEEGVAGDFAAVIGAESPNLAHDKVAIDVGIG